MKIRAHTAWGCPCTVKLDGKGRYESAVDYFGALLPREQVRVPATVLGGDGAREVQVGLALAAA